MTMPRDTDTIPTRPDDGLDLLNGAVCFALYSATQATVQYYRDVLAPFGITYQQLLVLAELWQEDTRTPGQLADALHLDSSTISGLLNRMEKQDLIVRRPDARDRRAVRVQVTSRGREISGDLGFLPECLAQAMNLSSQDAQSLLSALHRLRDTIASAPRPAPQPTPSMEPVPSKGL